MIKYENKEAFVKAEREKKRQCQAFRRFISFKGSGAWLKYYLGNDIAGVREWIESNMVGEMTWENYGELWVIDHIVPLRMFDLFNEEDLKICWHYKNLMPLLKIDNEKKNGNVFFSFELLYPLKDKDIYFLRLFERVKIEVEWMAKYIDTYLIKYQ